MSQGKRMKTDNMATSKKRRKDNKALGTSFKLIAFAYVVITIIFYISILKMNMLPGWVIAMFTIAEIIFTFAMVVGLIKKHRTYKLTVLCFIIVLLVSGIYIYVTRYVLATSNFLGEVLKEFAETEDYYIVVRKESSYSKIEDIANKDVYMFQVADDVKSKIANKVSITFNSKNNLTDIGNDLIQKNIDVILVSSTQYNMISEEIKDFKTDTKIIYTEKHELQTSTKTDNTASKYSIKSGKFNVYISGIDTSGDISNVSRSDANILATVNTETHEVLLTSIPRDYYVKSKIGRAHV